MSRISQLLKNLRYISKIDLRKNRLLSLGTEDFLENLLYYIPNSSIVRPNILNAEQTLDELCNSKKSLARFGDGEIFIISGHDIPFQKYNPVLAQRMRDILLNKNNQLMIGINYWYFFPEFDPNQNSLNREFSLFTMPKCRKSLMKFIDLSKNYCDAGFTTIRSEKNKHNDDFFNKIREIWDNQEVVLVGCRQAQQKLQHNLFDNAAKINWIYVPNINAFDEYDKILQQIKNHPKNAIIILMAGPTSKVLAFDLDQDGYRALDLGHIAKSYDYYMRQVKFTTEVEKDFWQPDL